MPLKEERRESDLFAARAFKINNLYKFDEMKYSSDFYLERKKNVIKFFIIIPSRGWNFFLFAIERQREGYGFDDD